MGEGDEASLFTFNAPFVLHWSTGPNRSFREEDRSFGHFYADDAGCGCLGRAVNSWM
jgi:hypothetical protein